LEVQSKVETKHYMFGLLLPTPKVGGQEFIYFLLAMHGTPSTKLGSSKHGVCKLFSFQPPIFKAKSRMLIAKKFVFNHT
jgi:hypothetical protein